VIVAVSHQTVEADKNVTCGRDDAIELGHKRAASPLVREQDRVERFGSGDNARDIFPVRVTSLWRRIFGEADSKGLQSGDIQRLMGGQIVTDRRFPCVFTYRGRSSIIEIAGSTGNCRGRRWRRRRRGWATGGGIDGKRA